MTKFAENDMEKVDRLMELHFKFMGKVEMINSAIDERVKKKIIYNKSFIFNMHKI